MKLSDLYKGPDRVMSWRKSIGGFVRGGICNHSRTEGVYKLEFIKNSGWNKSEQINRSELFPKKTFKILSYESENSSYRHIWLDSTAYRTTGTSYCNLRRQCPS